MWHKYATLCPCKRGPRNVVFCIEATPAQWGQRRWFKSKSLPSRMHWHLQITWLRTWTNLCGVLKMHFVKATGLPPTRSEGCPAWRDTWHETKCLDDISLLPATCFGMFWRPVSSPCCVLMPDAIPSYSIHLGCFPTALDASGFGHCTPLPKFPAVKGHKKPQQETLQSMTKASGWECPSVWMIWYDMTCRSWGQIFKKYARCKPSQKSTFFQVKDLLRAHFRFDYEALADCGKNCIAKESQAVSPYIT